MSEELGEKEPGGALDRPLVREAPAAVAKLLDAHIGDDEEIFVRLALDLRRDLDFGERWLCVTSKLGRGSRPPPPACRVVGFRRFAKSLGCVRCARDCPRVFGGRRV